MKIVCISDTHNLADGLVLPDGDVLIHAGDHTGLGTKNQLNEAAEWLGSFRRQFERIITIAGNHDFAAQREPGFANIAFARHGVKYLEETGVWFNDVYFYGSPWTPWFHDWAFNFPNPDIGDPELAAATAKRFWSYIPDRTNVLITHGPPRGILDKTVSGWDNRVGCQHLLERIETLAHLKLHVFGHIHEENGVTERAFGDRTVGFVNASICDRQLYIPRQPYHEVTI